MGDSSRYYDKGEPWQTEKPNQRAIERRILRRAKQKAKHLALREESELKARRRDEA